MTTVTPESSRTELFPARARRKPTLSQFCDTVGTLWGSDRVLRTIQYAAKTMALSPELTPETRALAATFASSFSSCRYINRIYGICDGVEGLMYDLPSRPASERTAVFLIYGLGGVGFHILENLALILMIIRKCNPEKIPKTKNWLEKRGLWDAADDLDALAQIGWFFEAVSKLYLNLKHQREIDAKIYAAKKKDDAELERKLRGDKLILQIDIIKLICDVPMSIHFASMYGNRPGVFNNRLMAILGVIASSTQFISRFKKQA